MNKLYFQKYFLIYPNNCMLFRYLAIVLLSILKQMPSKNGDYDHSLTTFIIGSEMCLGRVRNEKKI